jgi:lipoprotein-releasing system ATP-binding protein
MSKLLEVSNLTKSYTDGQLTCEVLHQVSLTIQAQESVAVVGESGSGKSTLLHLLGALDRPCSGDILFQGESVFEKNEQALAQFRNQHLGFIYQFHHLLSDFSAHENIMMPGLIAGQSRNVASARAMTLLEQVDLSHRAKHRPSELSGGERQRVAIGRALMNQPQLVLADEPTGNLDGQSGAKVYSLMKTLMQEHGTSFVVVTHDRQLAAQLDRTLVMCDGKLKE